MKNIRPKCFVICKVEAKILTDADIGKINNSKVISVVAVVNDPKKISLYTKQECKSKETYHVYPCNILDFDIVTQANFIDIKVFEKEGD